MYWECPFSRADFSGVDTQSPFPSEPNVVEGLFLIELPMFFLSIIYPFHQMKPFYVWGRHETSRQSIYRIRESTG